MPDHLQAPYGINPRRCSHILSIFYTLFSVYLVYRYTRFYGWWNLLWFCDFANLILCLGLLLCSRLLVSWSAVGVFIPLILWPLDLAMAFFTGQHPIGGTEYMFNPAIPLEIRLLSFYHIPMLLIIIFVLHRTGYDERAFLLQVVSGTLLLIFSYFLTPPERNINWVYGLSGRPQSHIHPHLYFMLCLVLYPLFLFLPNHLLLRKLFRKK